MSLDTRWLILAYTLPPEPSRMRVSIWRRLRRLGAVYMEEGFWVLPFTEGLSDEVKTITCDIEDFQGKASAFVSRDLGTEQDGRLRSRITSTRNEEYAELQGQCERFMAHMQHAKDTERNTFAEVEELEAEVTKLERWLREIRQRDFFGSPMADRCADSIDQGRAVLQVFTEQVFGEFAGRQKRS